MKTAATLAGTVKDNVRASVEQAKWRWALDRLNPDRVDPYPAFIQNLPLAIAPLRTPLPSFLRPFLTIFLVFSFPESGDVLEKLTYLLRAGCWEIPS